MNRRVAPIALALIALTLAAACTLPAGKKRNKPFTASGAGPLSPPRFEAAGWIIARATMHTHTNYSDGCRTPEALLDEAESQGMAILSFNDHAENKMCAGASQLLCQQNGGVELVGYRAYYEHLARVRETAHGRGMLVLRGVEVAPYMHNEGKFPSLNLRGSYNHFCIYGVEDPAVFEAMAVRRYFTFKPEKDPLRAPYQAFVDSVVKQGGMVAPNHVEDRSDGWDGTVHSVTPPPVENILLKNITTFPALPDAWGEYTAQPGGNWDQALLLYLGGLREKPVWTHGDTDYHCEPSSMRLANTLFYLKDFTEADAIAAIREGRMVALQGVELQNSYVAEWWVSDGEPKDKVMLGAETRVKGTPTVRFALDHPVAGCKVRLIRNGRVVAEQEGTEITYKDDDAGSRREPVYYRVELIGPHKPGGRDYGQAIMPETELFVNPIFVRFE